MTASYTIDGKADGELVFTNIYTPKPTDLIVDVNVIKTVVNKGSEKIGPEGFEFLLNALADGVADITVKSDENGKAKFTLTFTEEDINKTYTYKLTEVNSGRANVTYSTVAYDITIAITLDEETNTLVASMTMNDGKVDELAVEFENIYEYTPMVPDTPDTGDNSQTILWGAIAALCVVAVGVLLVIRKKFYK